MQAVPFLGVTHVLAAPEGWDESLRGPCEALPIMASPVGLISVWKPSPEELRILNAGGGVTLTVVSTQMAPVALGVTSAASLNVSKQ